MTLAVFIALLGEYREAYAATLAGSEASKEAIKAYEEKHAEVVQFYLDAARGEIQ